MQPIGLFLLILFLLLLLVAFLYQIVTLPPHLAVPTPPPEPAPALALPASLVGRAPPAPRPAGVTGQLGDAGYQARHTPAALPRRPPPTASRQPWGPAAALILSLAGLTVALAGGWLFYSRGAGAGPCSSRAAEVCSGGYVLLTDTQVLGAVICVAGIITVLTGLYLALRERPRR